MPAATPVKLRLPSIMISQSYIIKWGGLLLIWGFLLAPNNVMAQFIDLTLDIDAEITARTEQPLDFGTLTTNSGRRSINLGSVNMGIFSITALENQVLLINSNMPAELLHDNPAISDVVPIDLQSRYGYSSENFEASESLPSGMSSIKVETNPDPGPWNTIYLFIYGSVDIGNISDGIYANNIIVNVEYI